MNDELLKMVAQSSPLGLTPHALAKTTTYYTLASQAQHNTVELGASRGVGTIALIAGAASRARGAVWSVDDYVTKQGWIGEPYGPQDELEFQLRVGGCPAEWRISFLGLIRKEVRVAAKEWDNGPISLLLWDLGVKGRAYEDLCAWMLHVELGGIVCGRDNGSHGLGVSAALHEFIILEELKDSQELPGDVYAATRC